MKLVVSNSFISIFIILLWIISYSIITYYLHMHIINIIYMIVLSLVKAYIYYFLQLKSSVY